jgi:hypothetical protein
MGSWGVGLYSGDFAADLRGAVSAVARLPFDGERLVELLCETESAAAREPADPDHTVFWLVVADQFAKRGIPATSARDTALGIIDEGRDLATMASLGMGGADLRARSRMLAELRERLAMPAQSTKLRTVLKKPQPFLLETGDVIVFPTARGNCVNPYFPSKEAIIGGWHQDGWGAAVIVECGRAFEFLAWYRPLRAPAATPGKPDLAALSARPNWTLQRPGTVSRLHLRRMEIERVGTLPIDAAKLDRLFPTRPSGRSDAVSDISIANRLHLPVEGVPKPNYQPGLRIPTVQRLADIIGD